MAVTPRFGVAVFYFRKTSYRLHVATVVKTCYDEVIIPNNKESIFMNLHAIHHLPDANYAYPYDKETLHLRLRTAKDDVNQVTLHAGDPYEWKSGGGGGNLNAEGAMGWVYEEIVMQKEASTDLFDFWFAEVKPPYRRSRYGFMIENDQQKVFCGDTGLFVLDADNEAAVLGHIGNYFCHPFLNAADVFETPEWAKNTVWYQIFPERFNNADPTISPEGVLPWGSEDPWWYTFFGGDLLGITEKLDYLVDLGINGIYLCPIFTSPSTHKYDTEDYFEIDPHFGTKETFRQFVELAHAKGIKIMLDMVVNHCGYNFGPWQDVLAHGENSEYKDWFHIRNFPVSRVEEEGLPNYDAFAFSKRMPKMRTENPAVRDYFLKVARYWVEEFDIDGWRLDVANEVDHVFWREFRKEVRAVKDDIYILGEVWHDANPWLRGDQFDAVMNYPLTNAINDFIAKDKMTAKEFVDTIARVQVMYSRNVAEVNFNLLGSHDTARLLTLCNDNKQKALLAYTFLITQPGSPCVYYGDEIGMNGGNDPGCRKCMVWDEDLQDHDMFTYFKNIINLRKKHPALRSIEMKWLATGDEEVLLFKKIAPNETIYVVINNSDAIKTVDLSTILTDNHTDLLTTKTLASTSETTILPYTALWLK